MRDIKIVKIMIVAIMMIIIIDNSGDDIIVRMMFKASEFCVANAQTIVIIYWLGGS